MRSLCITVAAASLSVTAATRAQAQETEDAPATGHVAPSFGFGAFVPSRGAVEPVVLLGADYFLSPQVAVGGWTSWRPSETRIGSHVGYLFLIDRTFSVWSTFGFSAPIGTSTDTGRVFVDASCMLRIKIAKGKTLGLGLGGSFPLDTFAQSFSRLPPPSAPPPPASVMSRRAQRR
jgi:hypothetical protein